MKLINQLVKYWALLGGLFLFSTILVTAYNITMYGLDKLAASFDGNVTGFSGYEDYVKVIISCAALMFFPWCQLKDGHVSVDLFYHKFPHWLKVTVDVLSQIMMLVVALFLARYMWDGMFEVKGDQAVTTVLAWPEWPFYIPGFISLLLWALVAAIQLKSSFTPSTTSKA
jgi:TRAP-type C4-dicarboxylate transport system permease small subunit